MEYINKNIVIISSWYPSNESPSYGSFVEEQANQLHDSGLKVIVFQVNLSGKFSLRKLKKSKTRKEYVNGILVYRIEQNVFLPKFRKIMFNLLASKCIKLLKNESIPCDIIHSHALFSGGVISCTIAKKLDLKHIHTEHTSGLIFNYAQYNSFEKRLLKKVYNNCNKVLFVSNFAKDEMQKKYDFETKNNEVVHNLVSPVFFNNTIEEFKTHDSFTYISIGQFSARKNFNLLIESWPDLLQTFPDSKLIIYGDGKLKDSIEKEIISHKLTQSISIKKPLNSRKKLIAALTKSNVLLSSSKLETFGLTVAEANAVGLPVVATDSGGVKDIIDDETGIITKFESKQFSAALIKIQQDYSTYNPKTISKKTEQKFSNKSILRKLIFIYNS